MRGSSRAAAAKAQEALDAALTPDQDWSALAEDLFAVGRLVDGSVSLRRALADPSREGDAKRTLLTSLLTGKVSDAAVTVVGEVAAQRWAAEGDLSDTLESLGVQSVVAAAEKAGRADRVEDELFRFERIVASDAGLRDVLASRNTDVDGKVAVVGRLLKDKAAPETVRLAEQAVRNPRGRRLDRVLESYVALAAGRRDELTAEVTVADALSAQQAARLTSALEQIYGKAVTLQVVVDPAVVGGIRVQVGDEVIDGTVVRRLDEVRRNLTGN